MTTNIFGEAGMVTWYVAFFSATAADNGEQTDFQGGQLAYRQAAPRG